MVEIPTVKPNESLPCQQVYSVCYMRPSLRKMYTGLTSTLNYRIEDIHSSARGHFKVVTSVVTIHSAYQPNSGDPEPTEPMETMEPIEEPTEALFA